MTPKQLERIQTKIKSIRATLAAEKRKYGTYDDSRGQRYAPPGLYIQIDQSVHRHSKKLKGEKDQEIRMQLILEARALEDGF